MYGHPIVPLGENGYGVSTSFGGGLGGARYPTFTVFHVSDGFRQSLFSVSIDKPERPTLHNVFHDRIGSLMASRPHGSTEDLWWPGAGT
jgi:hypothetical protein